MERLLLIGSAGALLSLAACAAPAEVVRVSPPPAKFAANTEPPPLSNGRQSTTGDPNRIICRIEGASGTRTATARICKTAREWEEQRMGARDGLERSQRPQPIQ